MTLFINKMSQQILKQLQVSGLSEKESKVYFFLIENNAGSVNEISKMTHIQRTTVYTVLVSLEVKGLVTEVKKGKKKYFVPEHPQVLEKIANYKIQIASDSLMATQKAIPKLSQLFTAFQDKSLVTFYEGKEGVKNIFMRHVAEENKNSELRAFADLVRLDKFMPKDFFRNYIKRKEKLKITGRAIAPKSQRDFDFLSKTHAGINKKYLIEIKYGDNMINFNGEILLFGKNKVSFLSLSEDKPTAILIQDKGTYDMLSSIFEMMWSSLPNS
jgi:sugar-specific transcriptional regulator TrmB